MVDRKAVAEKVWRDAKLIRRCYGRFRGVLDFEDYRQECVVRFLTDSKADKFGKGLCFKVAKGMAKDEIAWRENTVHLEDWDNI